MTNITKLPIDLAIDRLEQTINTADVIRQMMVDKLRDDVSTLDLDLNQSDEKIINAKLNVIKTLDGLLRNQVGDANLLTKAMLGKKEIDNQEDMQAAAVEILKLVGVRDIPKQPFIEDQDADRKVEEAFNKAKEFLPDNMKSFSEDELRISGGPMETHDTSGQEQEEID